MNCEAVNEGAFDNWTPPPLVPENKEGVYMSHNAEKYFESIEPKYCKLSSNGFETNWAVYWKGDLVLKLTETPTEVKVEGSLVDCTVPNMTCVKVAVKRAIEKHEILKGGFDEIV